MNDELIFLSKLGQSDTDIPKELHNVMELLYHGIVKLDLNSNIATVLINTHSSDAGSIFHWEEYLSYYTHKYILSSDRMRALNDFSSNNIKKCISEGKRTFSSYLSVDTANAEEKHISMIAYIPGAEKASNSQHAYILARDVDINYLLNSIINQFVYNACDYFIYLDAMHNSYTMFSGHDSALLPPKICTNYEKEVVNYAMEFVAKEDQERVIYETRIKRILEQLDKYGRHSFSFGMIDPSFGYLRKHVDYRYHDKEHLMILLSRTDITEVYLEEEQKRRELERALKRAQTDPLTNLLNLRATVDSITQYLSNSNKKYALFFIDIDNFKKINDSYGHPAGDELLCNISSSLVKNSKENDIVGRVGGDEFIFFTELEEAGNSADTIAQKICKAVSSVKVSLEKEDKHRITGSIGIALAPSDGNDYYTLVAKADRSVYAAKQNGKNCYSF